MWTPHALQIITPVIRSSLEGMIRGNKDALNLLVNA